MIITSSVAAVREERQVSEHPAETDEPDQGEREGLELPPGAVANDRFGGTRTFSYVVRIHRAGAVDLGEIRIPYWDPQARAYAVARTALGIVQVSAGAGRDAGVDVAEQILPNLPRPRSTLEGRREV